MAVPIPNKFKINLEDFFVFIHTMLEIRFIFLHYKQNPTCILYGSSGFAGVGPQCRRHR
jgi:hypothetical protein